jgi:hypothetical protein
VAHTAEALQFRQRIPAANLPRSLILSTKVADSYGAFPQPPFAQGKRMNKEIA